MPFEPARYIESAAVRFYQPEGAAHPRAEIEGDRTVLSARIKRVFPLSNPKQYYVLQDGAGKEVGILRDLDGLDTDSRTLADGELDRRYFTPLVQAIHGLRQDGGMWLFSVTTQRGLTTFYVRNWRDSSAEIRPGRWQILSVDGQRFEIPDVPSLDARSQRLLEQLL